MENQKKSVKNLIYSVLGQIVTISLGIVLPRLFVVTYGSEVNGLLNSLNQLLVYLGLFEAGIGATTLQALYGPVAQKNWTRINRIMSAANQYYRRAGRYYFLSLMALTLLYPLIVRSALPYWMVCGAVFFSGIGNVFVFYFQGKYSYFLQAEGRGYVLTNLSTVVTTVTSAAKVILIYLGANVVFILAVAFAIQCIQVFYILWYVQKYPQLQLNVPPDNTSVAQRTSVLVQEINALIFRNTDVLILTVVSGLRIVSVYSMYKLITSQLENISKILVNSVSFVLGQNYQTDRELFIRRMDIFESFHSAFVYSLAAVAYFLMLPFMQIYTKGVTDINYVDPILNALFILIFLLDRSRTPMLSTITYAGHFKNTVPQTIAETAINLGLSLIGVCFCGIYGVLLGTVAALLYRTNDIILYSNHKLLGRSAGKTYRIYAVNIALMLPVQLLFRVLFAGVNMNSYLRFFAVAVACTPLSLIIFFGGQMLFFPPCRTFGITILKKCFHR